MAPASESRPGQARPIPMPAEANTAAAKVLVWDLPTRLFHWLLLALVVAAFITAKTGGGAMVWHGRCGLAILGLLIFRLVWGFNGATYARFSQFLPTPAKLRDYFAGRWRNLGHNPLGALSVFALLAVLAAQATSGLFANDDIAYTGYLGKLVSYDLSSRLTSFHHLLENVLLLFVALHVAAIVFYVRIKKHNLVIPMITGRDAGEPQQAARGGGPVAFIIAVVIAVSVVIAASGAFITPAPPPAVAAPDW